MKTRHLNIELCLNGLHRECCVRWVHGLGGTPRVTGVYDGPDIVPSLTQENHSRVELAVRNAATELSSEDITRDVVEMFTPGEVAA